VSTLRVTYRKSAIGYARDQRATLAALGLKRLHQTVEHEATPAIRGMVAKVRHLVSVDGQPADTAAGMEVLAAHGQAGGPAAVEGSA
jgi:large subunit ribosomal protein L30